MNKSIALIRAEDKAEDSDDDHFEFANAEVEEVEDNLFDAFRAKNATLDEHEVSNITRNISRLDVSMSILEYIKTKPGSSRTLLQAPNSASQKNNGSKIVAEDDEFMLKELMQTASATSGSTDGQTPLPVGSPTSKGILRRKTPQTNSMASSGRVKLEAVIETEVSREEDTSKSEMRTSNDEENKSNIMSAFAESAQAQVEQKNKLSAFAESAKLRVIFAETAAEQEKAKRLQ